MSTANIKAIFMDQQRMEQGLKRRKRTELKVIFLDDPQRELPLLFLLPPLINPEKYPLSYLGRKPTCFLHGLVKYISKLTPKNSPPSHLPLQENQSPRVSL